MFAIVFTKNVSLLAAVVCLAVVTLVFHLILRAVGRSQVPPQRRGLLSLVVGTDLRTSTSKTQLALWTYAIAVVLIAVLFLGRSWGCDASCRTAHKSTLALKGEDNDPFASGFQAEYLILLGFPGLAAVIAKGITSKRYEDKEVLKDPATADRGLSAHLADVVSDDSGKGDLGDFQYFVFNAIALGYFFVGWLDAPSKGLPSLPDTLVALTGSSAALYVAKKYVEKDTPRITRTVPPLVKGNTELSIGVSGLIGDEPPVPPEGVAVVVTFKGTAPTVAASSVTGIYLDGVVTTTAPTAPGKYEVTVRSAEGRTTDTVEIDVDG